MKTALILGIDGQDGSYLLEFLLEKGYRVAGWVPNSVPINYHNIQPHLEQIQLIKGSVLDQQALLDCMETVQPDEVYNLTGPSSPAASWDQATLYGEMVGVGVTRILEAIRARCPQARYYQASSSELFGQPATSPQNELTPFHPRSPYGAAKLYAHWIAVNYREKYGLYTACGILYNHESPRRGLDFVTRKITHTAVQIKLGQASELRLGNLAACRDWGYAKEYVEAMWLLLQQPQPDDFVIGTGHTHSVRDFCEAAFGLLGLDYVQYVVQDPSFYRPTEAVQIVADNRKLRERLGWQPRTSLTDLVRVMVAADCALLGCAEVI